MTSSDSDFAGSIPDIHERLMVPMLFDPYARHLADRVARHAPAHLLETAAGTGVLTRALASRLPADARIVATDLNAVLLDRARTLLGEDGRIRWLQADARSLPLADGCVDCVVCQFGVMFFPDRVAAYREARRVMRIGGRFVFSVWDRIEQNAFVAVVQRILTKLFPADPPFFMQRTQHGYHDPAQISQNLREAGFGAVTVEPVALTARAASALDAATAFCQGSPLRAEIEERGPGRLEDVTRVVAESLGRTFGRGPIEGQMRAFLVTATV